MMILFSIVLQINPRRMSDKINTQKMSLITLKNTEDLGDIWLRRKIGVGGEGSVTKSLWLQKGDIHRY